MSRTIRCSIVLSLMYFVSSSGIAAIAQEQPPSAKPGPEHEQLKKLEGTWDAVMKMPQSPAPMPGTHTYKMECDGMWLSGDFKMDVPGFKFQGRGLDGFDQNKKKYVGVWVDSMSSSMMTMEGVFDVATKTTTMTGDAIGKDGKPEKFKAVTKMIDDDHHTFQMFVTPLGGKETLGFTIEYTRRK